MRKNLRHGLLAVAIVLAACTQRSEPDPIAADSTVAPTATTAPTATPEYRYAQLLDRDDIHPIYEPEFVPADQVNLDDGELVLGVVIDGEAKAYPINVLNYSEMVNDELAGIPILATW